MGYYPINNLRYLGDKIMEINIIQVPVNDLKPSEYNPRKWDEKDIQDLQKSIEEFDLVDPIIVNSNENRKNVVIGGHFRLFVAKKLNKATVPVVYVNIPDIEKEKRLNLRLNRNQGQWDYNLLKEFDKAMLKEVGFIEEELGKINIPDFKPEYEGNQGKLDKRSDVTCPECGAVFTP